MKRPKLSLRRKREEQREKHGAKHYIKKYWYVFFLIGIFLTSWWFRSLPGRWNELIGLDEFHIYRIQEYVMTHNLQMPDAQHLDMMRYTPLGVPTTQYEYPIPYYLPILAYLFSSAVGLAMPFFEFDLFFPAFIGAIGGVMAFFIGRELFKSNITGVFAAFFVSMTPALFTRTSAAAIDKEATAVIFMMASIWLFLLAYNRKSWFYGALSGLAIAGLALAWGGAQYIHLLVASFIFILFGADVVLVALDYLFSGSGFRKHVDSLENFLGPPMIKAYLPFTVLGILIPQIAWPLHDDITSISVILPLTALAVLLLKYGVVRLGIVKKEKSHYVIPALLAIGAVVVFAGIIFTPYFDNLLSSVTTILTQQKSVVGTTVAENAPGDWNTIFSTLGTSFSSAVLPWMSSFSGIFAVSVFIFLGMILIAYEFYRTKNWLLLFPIVWLISTIFATLWEVRLLYILGPAAGVVAGFFFGWLIERLRKTKYFTGKTLRSWLNFVTVPLAIVIILTVVINVASTYTYAISITTAICFPQYKDGTGKNPFDVVPCITIDKSGNQVMHLDGQPWYQAMDFLSNKTPGGSSILSWWDFGYWFQTRGNRPSVADGGNLQGVYMRNYVLAEWFTDNANNWSAWMPWMKSVNASYILMDYSLPGKYGAISEIASRGQQVLGVLEFRRTGMYPKSNSTIIEYTNGPYAVWLTFDNNGSLAGTPMFLVSQNGKYYSKAYINEFCTTNGIVQVANETQSMPGCIAINTYLGQDGLFYVPPEIEHTIFNDLMFMQGHGLPVSKVYDNGLIQVYKINYEMSVGVGQ